MIIWLLFEYRYSVVTILCKNCLNATTIRFLLISRSSTASSMVLVSCLQKKNKGRKFVSCKHAKKRKPV